MFFSRRFLPLFITQFLGAFNDNLFKNALVMLVVFKAADHVSISASTYVILAGALFMLPYFLFSTTAGELADKFDRDRIARNTKLWEIIVVAIGAIGFIGHHPNFLLLMLFALGAQSTFFGPVKYALLPQHLRDDELLRGNAYIGAGTFLAILLGTISGGLLIMAEGGERYVVGVSLMVAIFGYSASRFIPVAPAPMPSLRLDKNLIRATYTIVANDRKNTRVFGCIMAISWFWVVGSVFLSQLPALVKEIIGAGESVVTLFLAMFSIGVGIGSIASNLLVGGRIDSKFVPHAAFAMALFAADVAWVVSSLPSYTGAELMSVSQFFESSAHVRLAFDFLMFAIAAGIFIVPLYAIMQHDSAPETRARTIATNNIVNAFFMVLAAVASLLMLQAGLGIAAIFAAMAVGSVVVAKWVLGFSVKG